MDLYRKEYRILASDADYYQRLRVSRLFTFLQEAAIAHTEALGFGREKTLDRGLLWVVTLQHAKIERLPVYDEKILIESAPGDMMHAFYPRYYRICAENGETLLTASAFWMLMNRETRSMVFPTDSDVSIPGCKPDWEPFLPVAPKLPQNDATQTFTVPYSYADLNGHMNNTRYFDLTEDLMPPELRACPLREVLTEYTGEAKPGEEILLKRDVIGAEMRLSGAAEKRLFRISMLYER